MRPDGTLGKLASGVNRSGDSAVAVGYEMPTIARWDVRSTTEGILRSLSALVPITVSAGVVLRN